MRFVPPLRLGLGLLLLTSALALGCAGESGGGSGGGAGGGSGGGAGGGGGGAGQPDGGDAIPTTCDAIDCDPGTHCESLFCINPPCPVHCVPN